MFDRNVFTAAPVSKLAPFSGFSEENELQLSNTSVRRLHAIRHNSRHNSMHQDSILRESTTSQ